MLGSSQVFVKDRHFPSRFLIRFLLTEVIRCEIILKYCCQDGLKAFILLYSGFNVKRGRWVVGMQVPIRIDSHNTHRIRFNPESILTINSGYYNCDKKHGSIVPVSCCTLYL
jgi:hypothetical protein